ncbi:hypothetical protein ACVWW9_002639 [Agrococcus sp. UYP33]
MTSPLLQARALAANANAIPVFFLDPVTNKARVGTAFMVEHLGGASMLTVAHVMDPRLNPTDDWSMWDRQLRALLPNGDTVDFDLFEDSTEGTEPRFRYYLTDTRDSESRRILDIIGFNDVAFPSQLDVLSRYFGRFALPFPNSRVAAAGERLLGVGYPREAQMWPTRPAFQREMRAVDRQYGYLFLDASGEEGMSGGPLLYDDGRIAGLIVGEASDGRPTAIAAEAFPYLTFLSGPV